MKQILGLDVIKRSEWGAAKARRSRVYIGDDYEYVAVHHGASSNASARRDPKRVIRGYQNYHLNTKRWPDIFYHLLVDKEGNIYEGAYGYRITSSSWGDELSVCLLGNNDEEVTTAAQRTAIEDIWAALSHQRGKDTRLSYHRERARETGTGSASTCPGRHAIAMVDRIRTAGTKDPDVLGRGDVFGAVRTLQEFLNNEFGEDLDEDGVFGEKTEEAVRRVQELIGVEVDGLWGPKTRAAAETYDPAPVEPEPEPIVIDQEQLASDIVGLLYARILGRNPTPGARHYWASDPALKEFVARYVTGAETELNR